MSQFKWGINNDYAPLKHVLLGKPEYYKWVDAGPLIGRTLLNAHKTGIKFDQISYATDIMDKDLLTEIINELSDKKLIYRGQLEMPKDYQGTKKEN